MADTETEEPKQQAEQCATEQDPATEIEQLENLVTSVLIDIKKSSSKIQDENGWLEEEVEMESDQSNQIEEHEEPEGEDYVHLAADMAAAMGTLYSEDLDTLGTSELSGYLEEHADDAFSTIGVEPTPVEVSSYFSHFTDDAGKSKRMLFSGLDSEESLLNEEVAGLTSMPDEEEEEITVSDADMNNAHYMKVNTTEGVIEREHDVDLLVDNAVRAEAMKLAEAEMADLEKETKGKEEKMASKESKIWVRAPERAETEKKEAAGDGTKSKENASKDGEGELQKTEFVSATIEKLCFEMEDGVVWRKTHTKKRIRKKVSSPGPFSDQDEELFL